MIRRTLIATALVASCGVAWADAPPGTDPNSAEAIWFNSLYDTHGIHCCGPADCRHTMVKMDDNGDWWAWAGVEQFGDKGSNTWLLIPVQEVRDRGARPDTIRGAVVCIYGGKVHCADVEGGS